MTTSAGVTSIGVEQLRNEVIESEKAQADFIRWKLILVAGLASASLGFSESTTFANARYLICLVPLVCAYVDLIYFHQTLRILVIGASLRSVDTDKFPELSVVKSYELFAQETRQKSDASSFAFEQWAIQGSSAVLSFLVVLFGIFITVEQGSSNWEWEEFGVYFLSGCIGVVLLISIQNLFKHKQAIIGSANTNTGN